MEPREFFDLAHENFRSAVAFDRSYAQDYNLAGFSVRIEFSSQELFARLGRAFSHLKFSIPDNAVDLRICVWDSSQTKMISPPWSQEAYGPRGEIHGFNTELFQSAFDHGSQSLSIIDHEWGMALFWCRNANDLAVYEIGAPLRTILSWFLQQHDALLLHAGAICVNGRGALLAGAGGAGKSSTALLCLKAGGYYLADDYCGFRQNDGLPIYSIYSSAKISGRWLIRVRELRDLEQAASLRHNEKRLFFMNELIPGQVERSCPCHVLFLPRISNDDETTVEPATSAEALRALAPSSIFQSAGAGVIAFRRISELVQKAPARWLNLGRDTSRIADEIARCLDGLP